MLLLLSLAVFDHQNLSTMNDNGQHKISPWKLLINITSRFVINLTNHVLQKIPIISPKLTAELQSAWNFDNYSESGF